MLFIYLLLMTFVVVNDDVFVEGIVVFVVAVFVIDVVVFVVVDAIVC